MDTANPTDRWDWWERALAEPHKIGTPALPVNTEPPGNGYFRVRDRDRNWQPVFIWYDDDTGWQGERGVPPKPVSDVETLWSYACRNPVSLDAYDRATSGNGWADEPAKTTGDAPNDPVVALLQEYNRIAVQAEPLLAQPIADQATADRIAILARKAGDIKNRAEVAFHAEKAPALVEARRIDERWREPRDQPTGLAKRLKTHSDNWLKHLKLLEDERRRKAEEEAARLRAEAEEKKRLAEQANDPTGDAVVAAGEALASLLDAERDAEARPVYAGRTGQKLSLRTFYRGEITDRDTFLLAVRDDEQLLDCLQTICNRYARMQKTVPGMAIIEEQKSV